MARKSKINEQDVLNLYATGKTHQEIADTLKVSRGSVTKVLLRLREERPELFQVVSTSEYRKSESDKLAEGRRLVVERIMQKLKSGQDISLNQLGTIFGILFDKDRLLRGEATEHVAHASYAQLDDKSRKVIGNAVKELTQHMLDESRKRHQEKITETQSGESETDSDPDIIDMGSSDSK